MSQIMKAYLGVFLLLMLSFTAAGFLGAFLEVISAQDMHARFIDEIENSDYYRGAIEDAFDEAEASGYQMKLTIYKDSNTIVIRNKEEIPGDLYYVDAGKLELEFPFEIPFYGVKESHVLTAYIR